VRPCATRERANVYKQPDPARSLVAVWCCRSAPRVSGVRLEVLARTQREHLEGARSIIGFLSPEGEVCPWTAPSCFDQPRAY